MNLRRLSISALTLALLATSCSKGDSATINGKFHGYGNQRLAIEMVLPGSNSQLIDTMSTDSEGAFNFNVDFEVKSPLFINVRTLQSYVPLLVSPGEDIELSAVGNIYNNYVVEGSEGSQTLRELNAITTEHIKSLDSISILFNSTKSKPRTEELGLEYTKTYINLKREVIRFVISHPHSLASIVPLYQPLIDGRFIFDQPSDIIYYRTIADSLAKSYPNSPYVVSLLDDVKQSADIFALDSTFSSGIEVEEVSLPEIELKDAEGAIQRVSDHVGKGVLLIDFTSLLLPELKVRNREIAEIYEKYADKGFEIYQISLDDNKAQWLNAVVDSRVKWISVNDPSGTSSRYLRTYNVENIPANFLVDREGNIVKRDISSPSELESAIKELL